MTLPQTNATLSKVAGPGLTEDSDRDAAPANKWTGELRIYHQEKAERLTTQGGSDVLVHRSIVIEHGAVPVVIEAPDDQVTFREDGELVDVVGKVQAVRPAKMPGVQGTIRVWLEDQ